MRAVCILAAMWTGMIAAMAQEGAVQTKVGAVRLTLELSDGSRIIGAPAVQQLKMATDYADLEVSLSRLRVIKLSGTGNFAEANFQNGDLLSGHLAATEIAVKTVFGQVVIPMAEVRKIEVGGGSSKPMPEGLVLRYSFDLDEGDRVTDASGNGNDGKVHGATYTSEGKAGGAMSFSGDRELVTVGNPAGLQLQDFTIMAWIKRGSLNKATGADDGAIFGYGQAGYILAIHADGRPFLSKTGVNAVFSTCEITDGAFHQVAVTKRGSRVVFYLDGTAYPASDYDPGFEFSTDAAVGARADNLGNSFLGVIDEVSVFNRALSGDEVKSIYDDEK